MKPLPDDRPPDRDDLLADFADMIRKDKSADFDFSTDEELRSLEEMLLRLNRAFPYESLDEDGIKRMHAEFGIRRRRQAAQEKTGGRKSWLASLFHSPMALAVSTVFVIGLLALLMPSISVFGSSLSGAAVTQKVPFGLLIAFGSILIFFLAAYWFRRRK